MKVGDLIKVYNFSHRARNKFRREGVNAHWGENIDDHFVGLIVGGQGKLREVRLVMRPDGDTEFYNLDRLEIINESR